jgi:transposase
MHVLDVATGEDGSVLLEVESDDVLTGCPDPGWSRSATAAESSCCTTLRASDGRCGCDGAKRIWPCPEPACARRTWTEVQPYATPRAKLTTRATSWAVDALRHDDTTVSAIARHLGVAWDTCWSAIKADAQTRIAEPDRLKGIKTIGVDEHIWPPAKITSTDKAVTVMVDLTRDEHGCLQARPLDAVQGRSGKVYADWLTEHGVDVKVTVEHAALDPFRGYANAIRDELPDAVAVLDAFHVVKLAGQALDEVRRRVQQQTLHRRGHKDDPLYKVRRTLLPATSTSPTGNANSSTSTCRSVTPMARLRSPGASTSRSARSTTPRASPRAASSPRSSSTRSTPARSRGQATRQDSAPLARGDLGLLRNRRRQQRGTEAINGIIEKTRRLTHGFRNFTNYRIRIVLAADGSRPYRRRPPITPEPC